MMATVQIDVTQEDIDNGDQMDCNSCPIALAINREVGAGVVVQVTSSSITFRHAFQDDETKLDTPENAVAFIDNFDDEDIDGFDDDDEEDRGIALNPWVKPFSFKLDVPDEFLKGGR